MEETVKKSKKGFLLFTLVSFILLAIPLLISFFRKFYHYYYSVLYVSYSIIFTLFVVLSIVFLILEFFLKMRLKKYFLILSLWAAVFFCLTYVADYKRYVKITKTGNEIITAIKKYKQQYNMYPNTVADLVPNYLKETPKIMGQVQINKYQAKLTITEPDLMCAYYSIECKLEKCEWNSRCLGR